MSVFTPDIEGGNVNPVNVAPTTPQGSTTAGESGTLEMGAVTTAAPTYVNGTTNPLSLDINGNLRTTSTFTPSGTQDVNIVSTIPIPVTDNGGSLTVDGTVTVANPGLTDAQLRATPVPVSGTVAVTQSTSPWVVSGTITANLGTIDGAATAANQTTIIANQTNGTQHTIVDNFPADADALAQGSATSGQLGALVMGAVTTAAPTYTTATTNPLSIDTTGNLRVVVSNPSGNKATAATITRVATSTTAATVLTANAARKKFVIRTETGTHTYVAYGSTATSTNYTYDLGSDATLEEDVWTGLVSVVRLSGTGSIQVTDLV